MRESRIYQVAENFFSVSAPYSFFSKMQNYEPFFYGYEKDCAEKQNFVFFLNVEFGEVHIDYQEDTRQIDETQMIVCGRTPAGEAVFEFQLNGEVASVLLCSNDYKQATVYLQNESYRYAFNSAVMVLYSLATSKQNTALFHAACIRYQDAAYLFLGKSGTGKSTHASLWLKYNEGSTLLNDDNPVVRVFQKEFGKILVQVYGSPWSGKTACYKNENALLGGIVQLEQAPQNEIRPQHQIEAYISLVSSISGMRWEKSIADRLHETENTIIKNVPQWHLKCLPNEAAAKLCLMTIAKENVYAR
jgi:hypothetical protein